MQVGAVAQINAIIYAWKGTQPCALQTEALTWKMDRVFSPLSWKMVGRWIESSAVNASAYFHY